MLFGKEVLKAKVRFISTQEQKSCGKEFVLSVIILFTFRTVIMPARRSLPSVARQP